MSRGGGRGGRGRGGGGSRLNKDQLSSLGIVGGGGNDVLPGPVTQPPPVYPTLDKGRVPLNPSIELDYLILLKQDITDRLQLSASYLKTNEINNKQQPHQEIDKLVAKLPTVKEKFDWRLFPAELRPKLVSNHIKKQLDNKGVDVSKKLEQLEKLEEGIEETEEIIEVENDTEEKENEEEFLEEEQDEEMDDGTDYANNYFDNGENYEDEDDNADDGPIY